MHAAFSFGGSPIPSQISENYFEPLDQVSERLFLARFPLLPRVSISNIRISTASISTLHSTCLPVLYVYVHKVPRASTLSYIVIAPSFAPGQGTFTCAILSNLSWRPARISRKSRIVFSYFDSSSSSFTETRQLLSLKHHQARNFETTLFN